MQIGKLNQRIQIQEATETLNAQGGVNLTWSTIATVWGSVEPVSGREMREGDAQQARVTHKVKLRYRSGLSAKNRLVVAEP